MKFEAFHSFDENEFSHHTGKNLNAKIHIHRSFEFFKVLSGENQVVIDQKTYILREGDSVLIFPYQAHSYTSKTQDQSYILSIFSPSIVATFYNSVKDKLPLDNKFLSATPESIILENDFHKKAFAYYLCGEFAINRQYYHKSSEFKDNYFEQLLLYVNKNFRNECNLKDAVNHIGYDYSYISKKFKSKMGISFKEYVNYLRIAEAQYLLSSTSDSICEISEKCGFLSFRSFDREFRKWTNSTPSEYRKSNINKRG
ncbi:MAG: AraC family transcriptional regulator [Acutalibacteraceae bacterium]|nr:AraC family transcriptional regulator [Acutalibacteraceae bacterium]